MARVLPRYGQFRHQHDHKSTNNVWTRILDQVVPISRWIARTHTTVGTKMIEQCQWFKPGFKEQFSNMMLLDCDPEHQWLSWRVPRVQNNHSKHVDKEVSLYYALQQWVCYIHSKNRNMSLILRPRQHWSVPGVRPQTSVFLQHQKSSGRGPV